LDIQRIGYEIVPDTSPGSVNNILHNGLLNVKLNDPLVPFSSRTKEGD
jgi:hypothetical protein